MREVSSVDLDAAIQTVLEKLPGITDLYPNQKELLSALFQHESIFFTSSTNSGKTLPTVIFPLVIKELSSSGYNCPLNPKLLFITALNSLQLSLVNNVKALGIDCESVTCDNVQMLLKSDTSVLFVSPEVLKQSSVTKALLLHRSDFVLKVVDEAHLGNIITRGCRINSLIMEPINFWEILTRLKKKNIFLAQKWTTISREISQFFSPLIIYQILCVILLKTFSIVVNWGLGTKGKKAFRPAMALSTGELSSLSGKLLLMTATATRKTIRILQDQFPEVSKWKMILNLPTRKNVTIVVPPPDLISPNYVTILIPFIKTMKEDGKTYLILVRGRLINSIKHHCHHQVFLNF